MSERINLQELIDLLAQKQGIMKKDAEQFFKELFSVIAENIENLEPVRIKDFGTFKPVLVNARKSVNVNTGEEFEIPSHYKLSFVPDKTLRDAANKPFAHFESVILEDGVSFDNVEIDLEDSEEPDAIVDDEQKIEFNQEQEVDQDVVIEEQISITVDDEEIHSTIIIEDSPADSENDSEEIIEVIEDAEILDSQELIAPALVSDEPINDPIEQIVDEEISASEEPIVEQEIESDIVQDTVDYNSEERKTGGKTKWLILVAAIVIVGALALWVYSGSFENFMVERGLWYKVADASKIDIPDNVPIITPDSGSQIQNLQPDSVSLNDSLVGNETEPISKTSTIAQTASTPETKVTIEAGSTLRSIGLKYFGHKSFWVYIYQENKDKITNPNNVPIGTELVVPPSSKYGIDAKEPKSVEKAKQLEQQIYKQFGIK